MPLLVIIMNRLVVNVILFVIVGLVSNNGYANGQGYVDINYSKQSPRGRVGFIVSMQQHLGSDPSVTLVINDSSYILGKQCFLLNQQGIATSLSNFSPGMLVNVTTIGSTIIEMRISDQRILNIWQREKSEAANGQLQRANIYKEGRVWKN